MAVDVFREDLQVPPGEGGCTYRCRRTNRELGGWIEGGNWETAASAGLSCQCQFGCSLSSHSSRRTSTECANGTAAIEKGHQLFSLGGCDATSKIFELIRNLFCEFLVITNVYLMI